MAAINNWNVRMNRVPSFILHRFEKSPPSSTPQLSNSRNVIQKVYIISLSETVSIYKEEQTKTRASELSGFFDCLLLDLIKINFCSSSSTKHCLPAY